MRSIPVHLSSFRETAAAKAKPDVLAVLVGACNKLGAQGMATVHYFTLFPLVPRICCPFPPDEFGHHMHAPGS